MADPTRQLLQRGADMPSHMPDLDRLWRRGRRKRRQVQGAAVVAVAALVTVAAVAIPLLTRSPSMQVVNQPDGGAPDDQQLDEQPAPTPSPQPVGPMRVEPAEAAPGDTIALTFPEATPRGVNFMLQQRTGEGTWRDIAYLFTDGNGCCPATILVDEAPDNLGLTDPRVSGPGPDHVELPTELAPGTYRICELHGIDVAMCASLTVR